MSSRLADHFIALALLSACLLMHGAALAAGTGPAKSASAGIAGFESVQSFCPLESRLLRDAADGRWDEHTLLSAALIASGVVNETELHGTCAMFAVLAAELKSESRPAQAAEIRAAQMLAMLHRRVLSGGYDLQATPLPQVLASGRYNCVSATVLFNCVAAEMGLEVRALRLPNHTCSVLLDGNRRVRVEATSAEGVRGPNPSQHSTVGGSSSTPHSERPQEIDAGEMITDVELVAMIYYNRGVEALRQLDFAQAMSLNRRALLLDAKNTHARGNLLSAINKQALALAARKQFAAAMALVDEGLAIAPHHASLRHNRALIDHARHEASDERPGDSL